MKTNSFLKTTLAAALLFFPALTHASFISQPSTYLSSQSSLNRGLVGYWSFDSRDMNWASGKAFDKSGNGNDGALVGGFSTTTSPVAGKMGQALQFNGATTYVNAGIQSALNLTSQGTISAWVKAKIAASDVAPFRNPFIAGNQDWDNDLYGYSLAFCGTDCVGAFDGGISFQLAGAPAGGTSFVFSNRQYGDNQWHLITGTWDGTTMKLYGDGVFDNSVAQTNNPASNQYPLTIGKSSAAATSFLNGLVDDVRIYNRPLSASEVRKLYLQGQTALQAPQTPASRGCSISSLSCGLVGYWSFDSRDLNWATGKALDRSGQGNDGLIIGSLSTSTSPVAGKVGQGFSFSRSSNGYIQTGVQSAVNGSSKLTLSAWMKRNAINQVVAFGRENDSFTQSQDIEFFNDGLLYFQVSNGGIAVATVASNDTKWHHVVLVYDGTQTGDANRLKGYLDGIKQTLSFSGSAVPATLETITYPLFLGATNPGDAGTEGSFDDARVYNRPLSTSEIRQLYLQGQTALQTPQTPSSRGCSISSLSCGLVGYWSFDSRDINWASGKALDRSGQGNDGLLVGGFSTSTSPTAGKIGQGLKFDGVASYVRSTSVNLSATTKVSVSFWHKGTYPTSGLPFLFEDGITSNFGTAGFFMQVEDGTACVGPRLFLQLRGSAGAYSDACYTIPTANIWHHFVAIFDKSKTANEVDLYMDGVLLTSTVRPHDNNNAGDNFANNAFTVMASGSTGNFSAGTIDNVRIYNRILSASEVLQLYNFGK